MMRFHIARRAFSTTSVAPSHSRVAIVGAGCGGQSLLAQLARTGKVKPEEITVFDPAQEHHYQPAYTMVAGGVLGSASATKIQEGKYVVRPQQEVLSNTPGVRWVQQAVTTFDPENNSIALADGSKTTYDILVVNPGLQLRYDLIDGAQEALDDPDTPVGSMYRLEGAYKTSVMRESFRGGNALFTCPPFPIKCGGAPQKILYLCEAAWRKSGVRDSTSIKYFAAPPVMFPPNDDFNEALNNECLSKGIEQNFGMNLTAIDKDRRVATFKSTKTEELVE